MRAAYNDLLPEELQSHKLASEEDYFRTCLPLVNWHDVRKEYIHNISENMNTEQSRHMTDAMSTAKENSTLEMGNIPQIVQDLQGIPAVDKIVYFTSAVAQTVYSLCAHEGGDWDYPYEVQRAQELLSAKQAFKRTLHESVMLDGCPVSIAMEVVLLLCYQAFLEQNITYPKRIFAQAVCVNLEFYWQRHASKLCPKGNIIV